jgi:hypothetical protein
VPAKGITLFLYRNLIGFFLDILLIMNYNIFLEGVAMTKSFVLYSIVLIGVVASYASGTYIKDKLIASDGQANDHFGRSVSVSSNTCVAGAYADDDDSGSVYVYRFNGESFSEEAKLPPSDDAAASRFGYSVSIDNDVCVAGAFEDDENCNCSGSAYVFFSDGADWFYEAKLLASDGSSGDSFGSAVSHRPRSVCHRCTRR